MTKNTPFDCVRMKSDLQQKLRQAEAGKTLAERKRLRRAGILADPVLGPWFRRLHMRPALPVKVAETPARYPARRRK